jgi:hypothetical protein
MKNYEYGRIRILATKLAEAGVSQDIADRILEGGELVLGSTKPDKKADWMREAMSRMDTLLDPQTRHAIREGCACCLGGKRLQISKGIAKEHESLEDRIEAANKARFVFGHSVTKENDGKIVVRFAPEGQESYRCVCLPKAKEPVSITYCYCCGGHVKHHLQTALGRKLSCQVQSSPLSTGGKSPCTFIFAINDDSD